MKMKPAFQIGLRSGLIMGVISICVALIGMYQAFSERILVGHITLTTALIIFVGFMTGYFAIRKMDEFTAGQKAIAAATAGVINGTILALLVILVDVFDLRNVLVNATPQLVDILTFGYGIGWGSILLIALYGVLALLPGLLEIVPRRISRSVLWGITLVALIGLFWEVLAGLAVTRFVLDLTGFNIARTLSWTTAVIIFVVTVLIVYFRPNIDQSISQRRERMSSGGQQSLYWAGYILLALGLLLLPLLVGQFWAQTLTTIGLFTLAGFGLNIVVGLAGLLDLGYVAFFAIGAYTMGLFSSPASALGLELSFWVALPLSLVVAATAGILLGIPVLPLRGDYLAIVTLGFGEIIRVLALSDLLKPLTGGPQGVLEIPAPHIFGISMKDPRLLYYLILAACLFGVFVSIRLNFSRIGRAWIAMREDEDVAQAMGIHLVAAKLMAFSIGAALAGIGGAIFASRQGAIFPADFTLFISINVLCLIIIGGIGSIPGTIVGALFLVGLPEVLRELDEYRILAYGLGLIVMMIVKPEGLLPSARRKMELHEHEDDLPPEAIPITTPAGGQA